MIITTKKNLVHSVWYKSGSLYMYECMHLCIYNTYIYICVCKYILISDAFLVSVWSCGFILMTSLSDCFLVLL